MSPLGVVGWGAGRVTVVVIGILCLLVFSHQATCSVSNCNGIAQGCRTKGVEVGMLYMLGAFGSGGARER